MRKFLLLLAFLSAPAFAQLTKAGLSSDAVLPSGQLTHVRFNVTEFDIPIDVGNIPGPGGFSGKISQLAGGYIFAFTPGFYFFWAQVDYGQSCAGTRRTLFFLLNGDERKPFGSVGINPPFLCDEHMTLQLHGMTFMQAGDYVGVYAYQDTGADLPVNARFCADPGCSFASWFTALRVFTP